MLGLIKSTLKLKGVADLLKNLQEIDKKVARKSLRAAVAEAVKPVLKDAKANVPVETRTLKKSLGKKVKAYRNALTVVGIVGPRKDKTGAAKDGKIRGPKNKRLVYTSKSGKQHWRNPVKYAHLVEFGTRPHTLSKGDRIARKDGKRSHQVKQSSGGRKHPGTKPQPFLRPALDKNRSNVRRIMKRVLQQHLKQARKGKK